MSEQATTPTTTNTTAPTTTPTTPAVAPTAGVQSFTHKFNEVDIRIERMSTAERQGKNSVAYWGVPLAQFNTTKKDDKGNDILDETATIKRIVALFGFDRIVAEWCQPKLNANLKATQLDAGNDSLTMEEKATAIKAYIDADFGRTSKGGGGLAAAFNNMKASFGQAAARQIEINKRMFEIGKSLVDTSVDAATKVKLLEEMTTLSTEATTLGAAKK